MQSLTVILATGGTIAGRAARSDDTLGYRAGEVGVGELVAAVPALAALPIELEQLAQIDSREMSHALWQRLARRLSQHLARPEVGAVVVTHGTDTLEETAYFLQRVLAPDKPVVLTAAMRPASALSADGPRNLLDAVTVAREPGARGVVAVLDGRVWSGLELRKRHTTRLDAFDGGDAGPIAAVQAGRVQAWRDWPASPAAGLERIERDASDWPWVAVLSHHAGADGREVGALRAAGVQGIVVAGTGHGTVSASLQAALVAAADAGVTVWRASRCAAGPLHADAGDAIALAPVASPWAARIEMLLALLAR